MHRLSDCSLLLILAPELPVERRFGDSEFDRGSLLVPPERLDSPPNEAHFMLSEGLRADRGESDFVVWDGAASPSEARIFLNARWAASQKGVPARGSSRWRPR